MIEYRKIDITTVERGIVAHGVNCRKRMGSGVAAAIKRKWPAAYLQYIEDTPFLGNVGMVQIEKDLWIANCYTQKFYGYDGKQYASLDAIKLCFAWLSMEARRKSLPVYMPKIGCGLGGLLWTEVEPLLSFIDIDQGVDSPEPIRFIVCEL